MDGGADLARGRRDGTLLSGDEAVAEKMVRPWFTRAALSPPVCYSARWLRCVDLIPSIAS
jgi:hypothetical protein